MANAKSAVDIDGRLLYNLAQAERAMHTRLDRELAAYGISLVGYSVLRLLAQNPGITASEIARRTLITQQASSRLTSRLIAAGYLNNFAANGRRLPLRLTRQGKRALTKADPVVADWERRAASLLGDEDVERLRNCLAELTAFFD